MSIERGNMNSFERTIPLDFSGKLNVDDAVLPKGDYREALNIIKTHSESGSKDTIKKLKSIDLFASSIPALASSVILSATIDSEGNIYVLCANGTQAEIRKVSSAGSISGVITSYTHEFTGDFYPEIRFVGGYLVWNYHGQGTPLIWDVSRSVVAITNIEDITVIKRPPVFIDTSINTGTASVQFENKHDFAARYVYDSGEVSALSNFCTVIGQSDLSDLNYGIDGIESVDITISADHPTYAAKIEWYARVNEGSWRRITTTEIDAVGNDQTITFDGSLGEALDSQSASKQFDSVPIYAKCFEVSKNRLFLANTKDSLDEFDSSGMFSGFTPDFGPDVALNTDMSINAPYFKATGVVVDDSIDTDEISNRRCLIPRSRRFVGVQFLDGFLRTRGAIAVKEISSGNSIYSISNVRLASVSTNNIPSWAKYLQLVVSENLDKDFSIEGYASSVFYEMTNTDGSGTYLSEFVADPGNLERIVVSTDVGYNYQEGDRMSLNVTRDDSYSSFLDFKIVGSDSGKIYLDPGSYRQKAGAISRGIQYNLFEIYSPKSIGETVIFNGTKHIIETTSIDDSSTWFVDFPNPEIHEVNLVKERVSFPLSRALEFSPFSVIDVDGVGVSGGEFKSLLIKDRSVYDSAEDSERVSWSKVVVDPPSQGYSLGSTGSNITSIKIDSNDAATYNKHLLHVRIEVISNIINSNPKNNFTIRVVKLESRSGSTATTVISTLIDDLALDKIESRGYTYTEIIDSPSISGTDYDEYYVEVVVNPTGSSTAAQLWITTGSAMSMNELDDNAAYNKTENLDRSGEAWVLSRKPNTLRNNDASFHKLSGKPFIIDEGLEAKETPTKIRWGGKLIPDSNINEISSFYFADQKTIPSEAVSINTLLRVSRMSDFGSVLLAICDSSTHSMYVEESIITSQDGVDQITASDDVIGSIQKLKGDYGINISDGGSVATADGKAIWWDRKRGEWMKYTREGLVPLSTVYKMKSEFLNYTGSGDSAYDPFHDLFILSNDGSPGKVFLYNDRDGFVCETELSFVAAVHYGNHMYLFTASSAYKNLGSGFNSLMGTSVDSSITFELKTPLPIEPLAVKLRSYNFIDQSEFNGVKDGVFTVTLSNETSQETTMTDRYSEMDSGYISMDVMMDENSTGGQLNGIPLQGLFHTIKIELNDNTIEDKLEEISLIIADLNGFV